MRCRPDAPGSLALLLCLSVLYLVHLFPVFEFIFKIIWSKIAIYGYIHILERLVMNGVM